MHDIIDLVPDRKVDRASRTLRASARPVRGCRNAHHRHCQSRQYAIQESATLDWIIHVASWKISLVEL